MKNIVINNKPLDRQDLANKHRNMPYHERLSKVKAIDLRENSYFVDLGNGYGKFKPIDENKIIR